jgi:hypothetical protein
MTGPTSDTDCEDSAWAEALAGRAPEGMDPATRRQADLLRAGLQRRKAKLDAGIEAPSEGNFQRLLFRLRQEGIDRPKPAVPPLHRRPAFWGIAASLMLATVITLQQVDFMGGQEDELTMRSAPEKATVRLVDDVSASRDELVALLKQAGAVPKVRVVKSTGELVVEVEASQAVLDILGGDPLRMHPDIQDGRITVVLRPVKPKP